MQRVISKAKNSLFLALVFMVFYGTTLGQKMEVMRISSENQKGKIIAEEIKIGNDFFKREYTYDDYGNLVRVVLYTSSVEQRIAVSEDYWSEELKLEIDMTTKGIYVYDIFESTWRLLMTCFNVPDMKGNFKEQWNLNDKVANDKLRMDSDKYRLLPLIMFINNR